MNLIIDFYKFYSARKISIMLLLIFISINQIKSQPRFVESGKKYSNVKMHLSNYKFIKARNLILTNDSTLNYENSVSGSKEFVLIKNVKFISEKRGSYALEYGLVGAGIGILSVLSTQGQNADVDVNWAPFYLGFAAGAGLIGTLIGACIPKWQRLQFKDKGETFNFKFTPNIKKKYVGLGLAVNF